MLTTTLVPSYTLLAFELRHLATVPGVRVTRVGKLESGFRIDWIDRRATA